MHMGMVNLVERLTQTHNGIPSTPVHPNVPPNPNILPKTTKLKLRLNNDDFDPTEIESDYHLFIKWSKDEEDSNIWTMEINPEIFIDAETLALNIREMSDEFEPHAIDKNHMRMKFPLEYADELTGNEVAELLYDEFSEFGWIAENDTVKYIETDDDNAAYVLEITATKHATADKIRLNDYLDASVNDNVSLLSCDIGSDMLTYTPGLFSDCTGITSIGSDAFNNVIDGTEMFRGCTGWVNYYTKQFVQFSY